MKTFLNDNFFLNNSTAEWLYHDVVKSLPIIDFHNHLSPKDIADDTQFENFTQAWLTNDHYKWRAMRALGIDEEYITGSASDEDKFIAWSSCVPHLFRNPLYHWTHLELKRYFDVHDLLSEETGGQIYRQVNSFLSTKKFSVRELLKKMKVQVLCTTDDPLDTLIYHDQILLDKQIDIQVRPTFRPDKAINVHDENHFRNYIREIEVESNESISSLDHYLVFLKSRHDYFHEKGCRLSDHGLSVFSYINNNKLIASSTFAKLLEEEKVSKKSKNQLQGFLLYTIASWNYEKEWVQQFHIGALRNNSTRLLEKLGLDAGSDSIGGFDHTVSISKFIDSLDKNDCLTKSILYNLNPVDNAIFTTMAGNFNSGYNNEIIKIGAPWWYLDQYHGIKEQINAISAFGILSNFIGMVTDSRSFFSFSRHEYFRRILCQVIADDVENGLIPYDKDLLIELVEGISYKNAKKFLSF